MYEGIQSEILSTTRFDENSSLSSTYLWKVYLIKNSKSQSWRIIPNIRVHNGKIVRWNRILSSIKHRSQKIIHVKSHYLHCKSLYSLPKICIKNSKNSGGKWSICQCIVYNTYNNRNTWTHIWDSYLSIWNSWKIYLVLGIKIFWVRRCYKFARLLLQFLKQIPYQFFQENA